MRQLAATANRRSKAIGKDGKPLAGAALKSFITKRTKDASEPKAVGGNGKELVVAAKIKKGKVHELSEKAIV